MSNTTRSKFEEIAMMTELRPGDLTMSENAYGDQLKTMPDMVLNLSYWDCGCETIYVHPVTDGACLLCGEVIDERPSSRESEVVAWRIAKPTASLVKASMTLWAHR